MVLQVNLQSSVDALGTLAAADANSAQAFSTTVNALQKMKENREWASEEQKKMRSSQNKAATAKANRENIEDTLYGNILEKNPDLYGKMITSGIEAKMTEAWRTKSQAESDIFMGSLGGVDATNPEQMKSAIVNLSKRAAEGDEAAKKVLSWLPPASELIQGNPDAISQVQAFQLTGYQDRKYRQSLALQNNQGTIESAITGQRGNIQGALQDDAQSHDAWQAGLDRSLEMYKSNLAAQTTAAKGGPKFSDQISDVPDMKMQVVPIVDAIVSRDGLDISDEQKPALYALVSQEAQTLSMIQRMSGNPVRASQVVDQALTSVMLRGALKEQNNLIDEEFDVRLPQESKADREASKRAAVKQMDDEMDSVLSGKQNAVKREADRDETDFHRAKLLKLAPADVPAPLHSEKSPVKFKDKARAEAIRFRESKMNIELNAISPNLPMQSQLTKIEEVKAKYKQLESMDDYFARTSPEYRSFSKQEQLEKLLETYNKKSSSRE